MPTHAHRLVSTMQDEIRRVETEFHRAWWESQTNSNELAERRRADLELELRRLKGDPAVLQSIDDALSQEIHDDRLRRQLTVLRLSVLGNQMDDDQRARLVQTSTALERDFASYRPELDGRRLSDNDIEEILRTSDDEGLRRRAWEASKEIGAIADGRIRELARLRNRGAHDLGFADHYGMSLELQELSEDWLFGVMEELDNLTREPFEEWKSELDARLRDRFHTEVVYPWHYADPFFQMLPPDNALRLDPVLSGVSAEELAQRTFAAWGIDLADVIRASDLYPRESKSQHAFCVDIDRSGADVRILANITPGEHWVEVMLHESGHAAYDVGIDHSLPYLLHRPCHTFVTEAIALMSGRFVRDPEWLEQVACVSGEEVARLEPELRRARAAQSLVFARWGLVMVHFERDLYADPEGDLDARWWELVERFQRVSRPPDRSAADWAAKIHLASAPVYYQNYLLGEMLASQLEATCRAETGGLVGHPPAGELLRERVFHPGSSARWDQIVETATGRALSAADLAASISV